MIALVTQHQSVNQTQVGRNTHTHTHKHIYPKVKAHFKVS